MVRVNEAGPFTDGGPMNDNGQTGRKLVMDCYGPHVAIGGGALSGKDPWRLDRAGALRTRQIAVAMVQTGFVREARVTFVWGPCDQRPSGVVLEADGGVLDAAKRARWLERFDPSLAATHAALGLARVNWENCARAGIGAADCTQEPRVAIGSASTSHRLRASIWASHVRDAWRVFALCRDAASPQREAMSLES